MARKKELEAATEEIKNALKSKTLIIGSECVMKALKENKAKKVYITSNCPPSQQKDIDYYCSLTECKIEHLSYPNDELGVICKKPFAISLVAIK